MASKDSLVSIIVPVYGTEAYLPACIESICDQSYTNLQIILVDDQSPDRCPEICDGYAKKDPRILVIHQKNNLTLMVYSTFAVLPFCVLCRLFLQDLLLSPLAI